MSIRRDDVVRLAGRALVIIGMAYMLTLGATFNGILNVSIQRVSLALLSLGVAIWQVVLWRSPFHPHPVFPLAPAMVLWGIAYAISTLHNPSGRVYIGLWYAGLYAVCWLILSDLCQRGLPGRWIIDAALLTSIPLILLAFVQVLSWFPAWVALDDVDVVFAPPRPPSALGNPNALGTVLAMLLPFGLVRLRGSVRRLDRLLWGIWIISAFGTLYLTYSRGAWLAAVAALVTLGFPTLPQPDRLRPAQWGAWWPFPTRRARIGLALLGFSALMLMLMFVSFSAFDTPRRDTGARLAFYEIASQEFLAHPLTGTGPFTFGLSILENRSFPPDQPHAHAHNLFLNIAAEFGIPGLVALAVSLLLIVRYGSRVLRRAPDGATRAHVAACGASLAAFAVHSMVDITMMIPAIMLLMLCILAAGLVTPAAPVTGANRPSSYQRVAYRVIPLALWGLVLAFGWWSAGVYTDYVRGERLLTQGNYRQGAQVLRRVAESQPFIALHHAEYGFACGLAASAGDTSLLDPGIAAYERALEMEPPQAVWWANLAALYWTGDQSDRAIEAMRQATHYAPDDPDMWLNLGVYYEREGLDSQAQDTYHRLLEIEPLWGHSAFWEATELRRDVLAAHPVAPTPYMQAQELWQAGQTSAALAVLEQTLDHDPTQPGPYVNLARLVLAGGQPERAQDYLDAAYVLVHTDLGRAQIHYAEAELARARGDHGDARSHLEQARELMLADETGIPLFYGREIAHFQFLRVSVRGALLPQLTTLGPDPVLIDLLKDD